MATRVSATGAAPTSTASAATAPAAAPIASAHPPHKMTDEQVAECKEAFNLFDKDGDGAVKLKHAVGILRALGHTTTELELRELIPKIIPSPPGGGGGAAGAGTLDFNEFLTVYSHKLSELESEEDTRDAFSVFDKDGTGTISASVFTQIMTTHGDKLKPEEVAELVKEADPDGDGVIAYDDLLRLLLGR
eukprot:TRINITY_DN1288_c0_g1_i1.p1 TRINITY_DN1288_c0_g1~~TRINITY_DN1288_c0_g1_i1.p1  ORF type:complete len:203 (+),score=56.62 TRINITY_DN1288_c0_g1_i1:42-611(+)